MADLPRSTQRLFGLEVAPLTLEEAVLLADHAIAARERLLIAVVNAAKIVKLRHDPLLRDSVLTADVTLADGQSVVWASRLLRRPLPERVAGIDLCEELLSLADRQGLRVFLLGARPQVLATLCDVIAERWPGVVVAGARDGYFAEEETEEIAEMIGGSGADLLFLGLPTPLKETFLARYGDGLGVPVLHGVGGSFDVIAGATRRAPVRWQRFGMEWAYRLLQEPGRLWKRYLVTNIAFCGLVLRELVRPTPPYTRPDSTDPHSQGVTA